MALKSQSSESEKGSTYSREEGNHEIEVEEDLKAELICSLEVIGKLKEKNRNMKKELQKYEDEKVDPKGELTCDQNQIRMLRRENMLLKE